MTPSELRTLGSKHGRGWQTRLARELPVNPRTVRRWKTGETAMHPAFAARVRHVLASWR